MTKETIDFHADSFKMKFAMALSVFFDKCHSMNNRQTYAFKELEDRLDIDFLEVEKTLRFFGFIVDDKTYKTLKNSYLRKIDMQEEIIHVDDEHLFNISSIVWEKQFMESSIIGLAERYEDSSVQIAIDLYHEIISFFHCGLKDRFVQYIKSNYIGFLKRIRNEVVLEFFIKRLDKKKKEFREIADLKEEKERMGRICSLVYEELKINMRIFEANMNYVPDWRYYYSYLVKYVENEVHDQLNERIKEWVSTHPKKKQQKIWKEIHKQWWEIFSETMSNFPESAVESMKKYESVAQIYDKYANLLPEYDDIKGRASENLDCEEMKLLIETGMKGDMEIKI